MEEIFYTFVNTYYDNIESIIISCSVAVVCFLGNFIIQYGPKAYSRFLLFLQTKALKTGRSPFSIVIDKSRSKQSKGLVAVLAVNVKDVETSVLDQQNYGLSEIYFAEKDGDYYNRNTNLADSEISRQINNIHRYYRELQKSIEREFDNQELFSVTDESDGKVLLTEKLIEIYSPANIKRAIFDVNRRRHTIDFIGDKIGLKDFIISKDGKLNISIYKTDHFTWLVFKEIFKSNKSFFQDVMLRANKRGITMEAKSYLVKLLAPVYSSVGIDIIVFTNDCQGRRRMLISVRNGAIERDGLSKLHVSVNETFSRTDYADNTNINYDLYNCVARGIQEELGIKEGLITRDMIDFHDFAIVTDEGEIGLSCYVDISSLMCAEQTMMYPGQDKFIENKSMLLLPYFKVNHISLLLAVKSKDFMRKFYSSTLNDFFCLPWMSFTPLLISRVMIRNVEHSLLVKTIVTALYWLIVFVLAYNLSGNMMIPVLGEAAGALMSILMLFVRRHQKLSKRQYRFLQPFVSQWNGNVEVVQSLASVEETSDKKGIMVYVAGNAAGQETESLSDYRLIYRPYVAVREKRDSVSYNERPVSFFMLERCKENVDSSKLKFYMLNTVVSGNDLDLVLRVKFEKDKYTGQLKLSEFRFGSVLDFKFARVFSENTDLIVENNPDFIALNLSDRHHLILKEGGKYHEISRSFADEYLVTDLFRFRNDYYWSCFPNGGQCDCSSCDIELFMSSKRLKGMKEVGSVYDFIQETARTNTGVDCGYISVKISGDKGHVASFLNSFISHCDNRRRFCDMEIYMLQLKLIRYDIVLADIEYNKKPSYKIYY